MFSHVTLGTTDLDRAARFYRAVLPTLGLTEPFTLPGTLAFGSATGPKLFIGSPYDGRPATAGNGTHVALAAPTRAAVDAFHAAALANGGTDEGAPGLRAHYTRTTTALMSAIRTATSSRRSVTSRLDPPGRAA